jgi:hypothetical protein
MWGGLRLWDERMVQVWLQPRTTSGRFAAVVQASTSVPEVILHQARILSVWVSKLT